MKIFRYGVSMLLIQAFGCGVDLQVPSDTTIACKSDADCLNGLVCDGVCVVSLDTDPPGLVNIDTPDSHTIRFVFDEPILETSVAAMTVTFTPKLEVYGTAFDSAQPTIVSVATPELVAGTTYAITVGDLTDRSGNLLSPNPSETTLTIAEVPTDSRAPDLLSPEDGAITGLTASLVWSSRTGATSYTVEVAHDAGFSNLLGTFEVTAPDTAKAVTLDDARSFYWRVRSNLSVVSTVQRFDSVGSTVYVYCPAGDTCADKDSGGNLRRQTGSKDTPYFLPSRGVFAAQALNASEVRIAARGGGAAYTDSVSVTTAINISGGYDSTFADSSYNPTTHPTILSALRNTMLLTAVKDPMVVKGLELTTSVIADGVLKISACDAVHIDRVYVHGAYALQVGDTGAGSTLITNSRFETTGTNAPVAILYGGVVRDSTFVSPGSSYALRLDDGAVIERSTIACSKGTNSTINIVGIELQGGSTLRNNVIISDNAMSALVQAQGAVTIVGNTMIARLFAVNDNAAIAAAPAVLGLYGVGRTHAPGEQSGAIITNNVLVSLTPSGVCFSEDLYADPGSFQNNVFVGCSPKVYADFGRSDDTYIGNRQPQPEMNETSLNEEKLADEVIHSGCLCQHGSYSGNIISPLPVSAFFVDYDGPDNQLFTVDDNNMRLLLSGDTQNLKQAGKKPNRNGLRSAGSIYALWRR